MTGTGQIVQWRNLGQRTPGERRNDEKERREKIEEREGKRRESKREREREREIEGNRRSMDHFRKGVSG